MYKRGEDGVTVLDCDRCPELCASRTQIVNGRGPQRAKIAFVGLGPGQKEDQRGEPFIGPAGETARNWLTAAGFDLKKDVYFINATRCIGPKTKEGKEREPTADEVRNCRSFLLDELEWVDPDIIVPAGGIALETLYNEAKFTGGKALPITRLRGAVLWQEELGKKMVPILHPASAFHVWANEKYGIADLKKALREAAHPDEFKDSLGKYQVCLDVESIESLANLVERDAERLSFDCVTPETPILTEDLTWKAAGELRVGDRIVGFDEDDGNRAFRTTTVLAAEIAEDDLYEVVLDNGDSLRCTGNHKWLGKSGSKTGWYYQWFETREMAHRMAQRSANGKTTTFRLAHPLCPVVDELAHSRDAGFLAGAFDADGTLTRGRGSLSTLQFTQADNELLEEVEHALTRLGFEYGKCRQHEKDRRTPLFALWIKGGLSEVVRFLSTVRPPRLLAVWRQQGRIDGRALSGRSAAGKLPTVLSIRPLGKGKIAAIGTEHRTYVADGYCAHNTETTSLDWQTGNVLCVGIAWEPGTAFIIPMRGEGGVEMWSEADRERVLAALRRIFENDIPKIGQNGNFDQLFLKHDLGIIVQNYAFDTMLAYHLFNEEAGHSLETMCNLFTDMGDYGREAAEYKTHMVDCPLPVLWKYQGADADCTLRVALVLDEMFDEHPKLRRLFEELTIPLSGATMHMEERGVLVDRERADKLVETYDELVAVEKEKLYALPDVPEKFNYRSHPQKSKLLFDVLGLSESGILTDKSRQPSTGKEALEIIGVDKHPIMPILIRINGLEQIMKTFLKGAKPEEREKNKKGLLNKISLVDSRLHTGYRVDGTETGRLSASPNIQNIAGEGKSAEGAPIREIFVAPPGRVLLSADYSQMELRGLAYIAEDEKLIRLLESGADVHDFVARKLFNIPDGTPVTKEQRRIAKTFNFGLGYGMTEVALARRLSCSKERARELLDMYMGIVEKLDDFFARQRRAVKQHGVIYNIFGRRRQFYGVQTMRHFGGYKKQMGHIFRTSYNFPVQSSSSDIHSRATIRIDQDEWLCDNEAWLVASIHDSVMIEVDIEKAAEVAAYVQKLMQDTAYEVTGAVGRPWIVPVDVDWGPRWEDITHHLGKSGAHEGTKDKCDDCSRMSA